MEENEFGDLSWRLSLENARVSGTFPLTPQLGLRPSVAYVGKGAAQHFEGGASYEVKLDYIEWSVLGVASTTTLGRGKSSVYALAGPALGFKTGCTAEVTEWEKDSTSAILETMVGGPVDCGDDFKNTDLGITAGVGFEWQPIGDPKDDTTVTWQDIGALSELKASLEILYTLGLQSIASDDSGDDSSVVEGDPKNRAFSIWLGVSLPIGG